MPVFFLSLGKTPTKLQEPKNKDGHPVLSIGGYGSGGMFGQTISMSYLAMRLGRFLERPVVDKTDLAGSYDFKLDPSPNDSKEESTGDFVGGIYEAIRQLGLQLKPGRAQVETIVIDSVSRPAEN